VSDGQDIFASRIGRLRDQHAPAAAGTRGGQSGSARLLGLASSMICACLLGMLAVALTRLALLHIVGPPDPDANADIVMLAEGGIALGATVLAAYMLRLTASAHVVLAGFGFWIALLGMHNLVHRYPEGWTMLYSERWVWYVTQMTEPNTLYFRGNSYDLGNILAFATRDGSKPEIKINRF